MIFIYLFEADGRYLHQVEPLFTKIETGKFKAVTSTITLIETLSPTKYLSKPQLQSEITRFFEETPGLNLIAVDKNISLESARLRREYPHLRTPDSIQLATAINQHADTFFTNDRQLNRLKISSIKIQRLSQKHPPKH